MNSAVRSLFERILSGGAVLNCGRRNGLYLLTIVPTKIANKTNVGTEFCGDTEEDGSGFRWLTGSSLSGRLASTQLELKGELNLFVQYPPPCF